MWILIAALALGDVLVAWLWLRERRRHRKSRGALEYWRRLHGPVQVQVDRVETDMARLRAELRTRVQQHRAGRAACKGDAA